MLKSVKFWLALSVCLNLLLAGLFIGGACHAKSSSRELGPPGNEVAAIMRAMPHDRREHILGDFRKNPPPNMRADIDELAALIDAKPFDAVALQNYFDHNRSANDVRIENAQKAMIAELSDMSDEERASMAEDLRNMPKWQPKRDGKRRPEIRSN